MSVLVQQHVVRLNVTVDEAHGVDGVQRQDHFSCVEASPLLGYVVVHGECDQVAPGHELHHHVEVAVVLERAAQLQDNNLSYVTPCTRCKTNHFETDLTSWCGCVTP